MLAARTWLLLLWVSQVARVLVDWGLRIIAFLQLREVGGHWERVLRGRREWLRALPVDPGLHRFPSSPVAGRGGRLAEVDFVASDEAGEVIATPHAGGAPSGAGGAAAVCRRVLLGPAAMFDRKALASRSDADSQTASEYLIKLG